MYETFWFLAELDTTHIARPYTYSGGNYQVHAHYGYSDYPAGQLRTSTLQLSRFLIAFMQGGEFNGRRILDSATVSLMTTVQYPQINPTQGLIWHSLILDGRFIWGHTGGDTGVGTAMFFSPSEDVGVIYLANGRTPGFWHIIVDALFDYANPTGVEGETTLPISYKLYQNYPNPFNPSTTIKYQIPEVSFVLLKVYDILGREVATIVNEEKFAGSYEVIFNDVTLPSGIYFYQIQTPNFIQTKKMILLK